MWFIDFVFVGGGVLVDYVVYCVDLFDELLGEWV